MSMKSLKDYLTESQKTYSFRIKVAGKYNEGFVEAAKQAMSKYGCAKFEKVSDIPIANKHLDFPQLENIDVSVYETDCTYPVTPIEISALLHEVTKIPEVYFKVRNLGDTTDIYIPVDAQKSGKALLDDPEYKEHPKFASKDYFGDDFNRSFLKDLAKQSKAQKKEIGQNEEYKLPKTKADKAGVSSPISRSPR